VSPFDEFELRTASQLSGLIRSFRRARGITQADLAAQMGISQQAYSALERQPETASIDRVLSVLMALDVALVLRDRSTAPAEKSGSPW